MRPRSARRPALRMTPVVGDVGGAFFDPGARRIVTRRPVHDPGRLTLQPVVEPLEIGIARPEILLVDEVVIVRADPQELVAGARLDIAEGRHDARLKDVVPGRGVKAGYLDRAPEIVARAKSVRCRMRDDLVEKRLPGREIWIAREGEPQPVRAVDERNLALTCRIQAGVARGSPGGGALQLLGDAVLPHGRRAMRRRQSRDVLRDPQPQPFHLDRVAFIDDVVVDARAARLREERPQARMALRSGGKRGGRARGRSGHPHHPVAPGLFRDPLQRVVTVRRVIGVDAILALGPVAAARVLVNRRVAALDDQPITAQYRAAHRRIRRRQPALRTIVIGLALRRSDAVRRALQNHREARLARLRQIDESVQPDAVAHSHHRLE